MEAEYKNWVPNGMVTALTAGTVLLAAGTAAAVLCADPEPDVHAADVPEIQRQLLRLGAYLPNAFSE